jgi:uncharacterized protein with HEPN domain
MQPDDRIRLQHMIEAGEAVARFVADRARADLGTDEMLALALARAIEIIGEAASRLSPQMRATAPAVPWEESLQCAIDWCMHTSISTMIS